MGVCGVCGVGVVGGVGSVWCGWGWLRLFETHDKFQMTWSSNTGPPKSSHMDLSELPHFCCESFSVPKKILQLQATQNSQSDMQHSEMHSRNSPLTPLSTHHSLHLRFCTSGTTRLVIAKLGSLRSVTPVYQHHEFSSL